MRSEQDNFRNYRLICSFEYHYELCLVGAILDLAGRPMALLESRATEVLVPSHLLTHTDTRSDSLIWISRITLDPGPGHSVETLELLQNSVDPASLPNAVLAPSLTVWR